MLNLIKMLGSTIYWKIVVHEDPEMKKPKKSIKSTLKNVWAYTVACVCGILELFTQPVVWMAIISVLMFMFRDPIANFFRQVVNMCWGR